MKMPLHGRGIRFAIRTLRLSERRVARLATILVLGGSDSDTPQLTHVGTYFCSVRKRRSMRIALQPAAALRVAAVRSVIATSQIAARELSLPQISPMTKGGHR